MNLPAQSFDFIIAVTPLWRMNQKIKLNHITIYRSIEIHKQRFRPAAIHLSNYVKYSELWGVLRLPVNLHRFKNTNAVVSFDLRGSNNT